MSELLPIIFARGQNESIDPRVSPPDVHAIARNVRWRKDGRPEKKYGVTAISTTGLSASGFDTQPVNAITSWNEIPILAVGSSVRQRTSLGWDALFASDAGELSHWGPGERDIVARDEHVTMVNVTSGYCQGMILHVWDSGTSLYYCVKGRDGSMVVTPRFLFAGTEARCISTTNYIYVLSKNGTALDLRVFNPLTLAITAGGSPGTLDAAGSHFDACGRGNDFLVTYQSTALMATTKLLTAVLVPVVTQTITTALAVTGDRFGVVGDATSNIFVAVYDASGAGQIKVQVFNNGLTGSLGVVIVEADANNNSQPGLVLESNTVAQVVWGGFETATSSSYMRVAQLSSAGVLSTVGTFYGVSPASKPFMGPAYSTMGLVDGAYVWVATHNADNGSTKWDSQRAYYLVKYRTNDTTSLRRQMHVPNVTPTALGQLHLSDVLNLGLGYGYITPLSNAIRFGNSQSPTYGFDAVGHRSIFESVKMAARDTVTAGRVLQFAGGSLFEFGGAAEETGFSNFPVIQSVTGGGGGSLTGATTYLYRAVYEWIDLQGRRHRSAPSLPFSFATGANSSATLVMKPLVADSHWLAASGNIAGRGVTLHVYRTIAGQATFHRVTPNVGAPSGSVVGTPTISYTDLMSDANAAGQEFIYTDGGVADNTLCPPHTFQTVCSGRLWVGGQLDRCVITATKLLVEGEPSQFSDLDQFSVFLPQKCTGLASIDGTIVAFARERIYFITGDGPNDQGIGEFSPPVELPTDVGCIDWRSVVETSIGVFFQSKRGIYLLPRGFNTPVFVGAEVEATLAAYPKIVSATLVSIPSNDANSFGEITVRFVVGTDDVPSNTSTLVYDLRTGGWSVDDYGQGPLLCGTWQDAFIASRKTGGVLVLNSESAASPYVDYFSTFMQTMLGTGDIRPFGVAGYGQFCKVVLVGEFRASCKVNVQVSVDGALSDTHTFVVTAADGPTDNNVYLDVTPKIQKGSSLRVTCWDSGNPLAGFPTEGFIMQALFIEYDLIGKTKRLAEARRA